MPLAVHFLFSGIIMYHNFFHVKKIFSLSYYQDCKNVFKCYKKIISETLIDLTIYSEFKSTPSNMSEFILRFKNISRV